MTLSGALISGFAKPPHGLDIVLRYAVAAVVHDTEVELGVGIPLFGENAEPSHGCVIVAAVIRRQGFVKCLLRRDQCARQRSQQCQGDNAAPNQPVFNACL